MSLTSSASLPCSWVQSYGSRCVRPPIVVGDIRRPAAMTVREWQWAQSCSTLGAPVKGMLTGPVTILNWSFPRQDISRRAQAVQLALALRDEVQDLEAAGCRIVQVDEPALREGLPLKQERWQRYLDWAVAAFRVTCAVARPETQITTHLCYRQVGRTVLGRQTRRLICSRCLPSPSPRAATLTTSWALWTGWTPTC